MITGRKGDYYWIEWYERSKFLNNLLSEFPKLVLDKYLVNTSFDSGSLSISSEQIEQGWYKKDNLTYSSKIKTIESISGYGYDEWYVFNAPNTLDNIEVFINYLGFSLHKSLYEEIQKAFWQQIKHLQPESFLAEGDNLICVIKDENLFNQISAIP